jgi:hypothetical protein
LWALAVEYLEGPALSGPGKTRGGKPRVDYKEVLSPADFALFAKLRDWRKTTAEKEGIPVYAVLTNECLLFPRISAYCGGVDEIRMGRGKKPGKWA